VVVDSVVVVDIVVCSGAACVVILDTEVGGSKHPAIL